MQENNTGNSANVPGKPQVVLNAPRLEYLIKCYDVSAGLCSPRHEAALLHDFVQAMTNSTHAADGPQSQIHGCEPAFSVADSCFNFFPLITFRTRATNRCVESRSFDRRIQVHDFMHEKKVFKTGWLWMYGAFNAQLRCGARSQVPKLPPHSTSTFWKVAYASCSNRTSANPGGTHY